MGGPWEFGVRAQRWLRPRQGGEGVDPPFSLDEAGFLPVEAVGSQGGLFSPEAVWRDGALVVLGEPGAGKTTVFADLTGCSARTLPPVPGEPGTVWVTGSQLTDATLVRELLTSHLAALPAANGEPVGDGDLVVVIDQLDGPEKSSAAPSDGWLVRSRRSR